MNAFWKFITDFGDSAVTLPITLVSLIYLVLLHRRYTALALLGATGACAVTIAFLKLLFRSCVHQLAETTITSPSGHTAMSLVVYGSLAVLTTKRLPHRSRTLVFSLVGIGVVAIAVSRLALAAHNIAEVFVGFIIGLLSVAGFYWALRRDPPLDLHLRWLAMTGLAVIAATHGINLPIEGILRAIAGTLRGNIPGCS